MHTSHAPRHARLATSTAGRWKVARLVLAGGVLVGIGVTATSAAWVDDAWFSAQASSGSVSLQASTTGADGSWVAADASPGLAFAGATFNALVPGMQKTATIYVRNSGSVCLNVPAPTITKAEPLAGTGTDDASVTVSAVGNLPAGISKQVTVTVTTPSTWSSTHQNQSSATALTIQFQGSTVASGC